MKARETLSSIPADPAAILLTQIHLTMSIERNYECSRCSKRAKLFWHPEVHRHHDYATVEEIEHKTTKNNLSSHPEYVRRMVGY
jgi:hypothetical protein